jgi:hypothetical protein
MSKELIIFVWPQLDDDSNGQASLVVHVGHSIPYAHWYRALTSHIAAPASIILIEEGPKAEARHRRHRDNISLQFGPTET